jgi:hypothetical protein
MKKRQPGVSVRAEVEELQLVLFFSFPGLFLHTFSQKCEERRREKFA